MKLPLFDRGNLQAIALINVPDHLIPRGLIRTASLPFEVKVNDAIILEPKLELVRVALYMNGMEPQCGWVAVAVSDKSAAMMKLAIYDNVEGIDEVQPQHRPAAREAIRRHFHMEI